MHRLDRVDAEPGGKHPVERSRRATALDVTEHRAASFLAGPLLDLAGQHLPHSAEPHMAERVELLVAGGEILADRVGALGDHDDGREPGLEPVLHVSADALDVERALRDKDHVGAAGQARVQRDPACMPAHHFDDQRPVMAFRGRVQPVDRLHGDVHGGVEAERVVGGAEIVVDRLRHPDDGDSLFPQPGRHAEGVLAADRDQRVDAESGEVVLDPLDAAAVARAAGLQRVGAR